MLELLIIFIPWLAIGGAVVALIRHLWIKRAVADAGDLELDWLGRFREKRGQR